MRVAVVGSGVSGLAATWLLNEHSDHEVHLYEADSRPGGHANTVEFTRSDGLASVDVDTGFIVLNPTTYPNFLRFLNLYNIPLIPTEMTFSVSRDRGLFEWAGNNLLTVFCQPSRLLDPDMWRLIYDVLRFNACARRLLLEVSRNADLDDMSIGEYLNQEGYSDSFRDNYLIPMTAAIWSTPPDKCAMDFPARTLLQFMHNHHLLQLIGKPAWLTIKGGSRVYVNKILAALPSQNLFLSSRVESVSTFTSSDSTRPQVRLITSDGKTTVYDHVILACHSDTALSILRLDGQVTEDEERILGRYQWSKNVAILHSDINLMPKSRLAWACWNYLTTSVLDSNGKRKANNDEVALTYWMNDLQSIPEKQHGTILVTLNPPFEPQQDKIVGRYFYDHPVLDSQAVRSQREMHLIQGVRGISYAGAYLNYGFHEDGFTSGLRAVDEYLDVKPPFKIQYPDRAPKAAWVAHFFDIFENTGTRVVVGWVLSMCLTVGRTFFGLFIDLRHLESHN